MALKSHNVIWSDEALAKKDSIEQYLTKYWTAREIKQFFRILDKRITLISRQPEAFPFSEKRNNYHRSVLSHQLTIYYPFEEKTVKIVSIFDTRQNPDKLNLEL